MFGNRSYAGKRLASAIGEKCHISQHENMWTPGHRKIRVIAARAGGRSILPFQYRDYGMLAINGRSRAVTQFRRIKLSGFPAWLLWCCAHIFFLIGARNRLSVMLNWA